MDKYTQGRLDSQVRQCRRQMLDDQDLCFTKLLPKDHIEAALERHHVHFRERLYTPLLTIWTFLYQVLASDQSCRGAVATHRVNDRPDRVEPRAVKRRPKKQVYLNEPRQIAKARLLSGS